MKMIGHQTPSIRLRYWRNIRIVQPPKVLVVVGVSKQIASTHSMVVDVVVLSMFQLFKMLHSRLSSGFSKYSTSLFWICYNFSISVHQTESQAVLAAETTVVAGFQQQGRGFDAEAEVVSLDSRLMEAPFLDGDQA